MSARIAIYPEVPGELGPETVYDYSVTPYVVVKAVPIFDTWRGDDLLEMFPIFLVTERLKMAIEEERLTGVSFEPLAAKRSPTFEDLYGKRNLPKFFHLIVTGTSPADDFALSSIEGPHLTVSDKALHVLQAFSLLNAELRAEG